MADEVPLYLQQNQTAQQQVQIDPYYQEKADNWKNKIRYVGVQIWPYVVNIIHFAIYETIKIIRGVVKIAVEQVKR